MLGPEKKDSMVPFHAAVALVAAGLVAWFAPMQTSYGLGKGAVVGLAFAGYWAMCAALAIGPIATIIQGELPRPIWTRRRRALGIWSAALLTIHLIGLWVSFYGLSLANALSKGWAVFLLLHFAFGYVVLMGATSNDASVKALGYSRWKALHRGIYLLFPIIIYASVKSMVRVGVPPSVSASAAATGLIIVALQLSVWARQKLSASRLVRASNPLL